MAKLIPEPVQVRIKGIRVGSFLDSRFRELLEKELPGIKFGHLHLALDVDGGRTEAIILGHYFKEHEANSILTIDCDQPETLPKLIRVIEKYGELAHG